MADIAARSHDTRYRAVFHAMVSDHLRQQRIELLSPAFPLAYIGDVNSVASPAC